MAIRERMGNGTSGKAETMDKPFSNRTRFLLAALTAVVVLAFSSAASADPADEWWDDAWSFRVPVFVSNENRVAH